FHPTLIHDPFGDPGLFVRLSWERRALLFDLGDLSPLTPGELLQVSDVFVSHAHMDHFIGFDQLIRIILGREKSLRLFGPPGIIANVQGKLQGYTWNLVEDYPLTIEVHEVHPDLILSATFVCREKFVRRDLPPRPFHRTLIDEPLFLIEAVHLDHRIPCLAFSLAEKIHINIDKDRLTKRGWPVGPWLSELKQHIREGKPDDSVFVARWKRDRGVEERAFTLGELKVEIVTIAKGQKIVYVVDALYSLENRAKIVELAKGADTLFCEAAYLERDAELAAERYHLTAKQAGLLAREAGVKRLVVFHFSPRYRDNPEAPDREAQEAFAGEAAFIR
ncbi:MAG: ribonuclease Z, partial [Candidatus Methylomirabilales bacterium]